jgi:hypothetical protein
VVFVPWHDACFLDLVRVESEGIAWEVGTGGEELVCSRVRQRKIMNKDHICTDCLFIGQPSISIGRLVLEFFLNFIGGVSGVQVFDKVRHCPNCGSHSMVLYTSSAGETALERQRNIKEAPESDVLQSSVTVNPSETSKACDPRYRGPN